MTRGWLEKIVLMLMIVLTLAITTTIVYAQPMGVQDVTVENSSRYNDTTTPTAVNAQAGNVTELLINSIAVTKSWQGFYGNITGEIILADADDNRFYDWNLSTPTGQVYASRTNAVTWTGIACINSTVIGTEETYLNQSATDPDSVTNTYDATNHPNFDVGGSTLTLCPTTQAYDSTGAQNNRFWQVLLADTGSNVVYTTIIEDTSPAGFNNAPWHFQLLVGENGKVGNEAATPYYFYLEIV